MTAGPAQPEMGQLSAQAQDALARELAVDPRRSVLLQAPAGSGKTTVLTDRLLRLLAEVEQPEEILAITFTRKAAAEMRARVMLALRGPIDVSTERGVRVQALASAVLARSAARGWNLENDPGRLRIQTIDSFNFRLAKQLTVAAGAGGDLTVTDRAEALYAEAARRTLRATDDDPELAADVEVLFERLDNNWGNVQRLIADMLAKRGHWLRYVLDHGPGELCARISQSLANTVADHLAALEAAVPAALRADAERLPGVGALTPRGSRLQGLAGWRRLAAITLTAEDAWRKLRGIDRRLGPEYENAAACESLRAIIPRLSEIAGLEALLADVRRLPDPQLCAQDAAAIESLSRVLRCAAVFLQTEFAAGGRVDHTFVAGAARAALTDAGEPTDLALRTGLALRHILVDEFQDTSLAQSQLIESLTSGWEGGDGRTLFIVGDPMQSIYQFREAEVGLFLEARDRGIGSVRLQPLRLSRNFRSSAALIEWSNATFQRLFPQQDDLRASAVAFAPSVAGQALPVVSAPVSIRLFADAERNVETAAVVRRICQLRAADPRASIAVLVVSRAIASPIMLGLEESQVDAVGVDLVPLAELSIVRDLVALLKALAHPGDRTAWLAVLRAPWCGLKLATLTTISHRGDPQHVWESMSDEDRLAQCEADERARIERTAGVLRDAMESRGGEPLADWIERTWLRLGAADAYARDDLRHARAFLDVLSERVASGEYVGTSDLDALAAGLYAQPRPSSANPVQIMTIHRAKGLEFDHVFVPSVDRAAARDGEPLLRWLDLPRAEGGSDLIMSPVPVIGDDSGGAVGDYLKLLAGRRAANERVRLLYVAATRARRTLDISGIAKLRADGSPSRRAGTLLACLWPAIEDTVTIESGPHAASAVQSAPPGLRRLASGWQPAQIPSLQELPRLPVSRQSMEKLEFSWVRETAREIGIVVHSALERFAADGLPDAARIEARRNEFIVQLRRGGVPDEEIAGAASTVVDALEKTIRSARGRWIFAPGHRAVHNEWALTGVAAGTLADVKIDRSFIDEDGTRWVIDYKTGSHLGGGVDAFLDQQVERYKPQMQRYVELARAMGKEPVRAGLYFPLLDVFREVDAG